MKIVSLILLFLISQSNYAQHTFSIVALDNETGEVGSAGATCLSSADCGGCGGAVIISGLLPGIGAINSQAQICIPNVNLELGISQMSLNKGASETLDYLLNNDQCNFGNKEDRQYGIVSFKNAFEGNSAAFTGSNALNYAGQRTGDGYAIQGNILIGPEVIDSMEARYLRSQGSLSERLMFALQGANIPGADSRCLEDGISSRSSYLRVAKPDDMEGNYHIDLIVGNTVNGTDPIDSLQVLFDEANLVQHTDNIHDLLSIEFYPNPTKEYLQLKNIDPTIFPIKISFINIDGQILLNRTVTSLREKIDIQHINHSIIIYQIEKDGIQIANGKVIID